MTYATWTPATKRFVLVLLLVWLGVTYLIGRAGILVTATPQLFQPVILTVIVPLLIFAAAYLASARFRNFVLAQDLLWLTTLQLWRVLGFTFLALYALDLLPAVFALPAGFGDVAIGISAALVVAHLARNPDFSRTRAFLAFHILGVVDFLVALITAAIAAGAIPTLLAPTSADPMALWPLNIFPGFFVPIFIMLHAAVFLQLAVRRKAIAADETTGQATATSL